LWNGAEDAVAGAESGEDVHLILVNLTGLDAEGRCELRLCGVLEENAGTVIATLDGRPWNDNRIAVIGE
jgi:hypothetical protein